MSKTSNIFSTTPIDVQNRSGFDMSFESVGTAKVGTLIPVLVEKANPGDKISTGLLQRVTLPPMATNFYGRVDIKFESFFVPTRLIWAGSCDYYTQQTSEGLPKLTRVPFIALNTNDASVTGPGTLFDYLGGKLGSSSNNFEINALPFLAYHRIWNDYYRNSLVQKPCFPHGYLSGAASWAVYQQPFKREASAVLPSDSERHNLYDGVSLLSLRQRNYAKDYFTTATPSAQLGSPVSVDFSSHPGSFTIAELRSANSLQKFLERNNLVGFDYYDQMKAQFGVKPYHLCNKPIFLGRQSYNVYNNSVMQTNNTEDGSTVATKNPFNTVGSKYGNSQSIGQGSIIDDFTATEHGYFFVLMSLVPHSYYATGIRRYLLHSSIADEGFPMLANVGDQALKKGELSNATSQLNTEFGYTQRYAEYKFHPDEVHGLLQDGQSLSAFCLKRSFDEWVTLGTDFLEIPTSALDEVAAVDSSVSDYGYWYDIAFTSKMVRALPVYSIPTLGEEKDVHTTVVSKQGSTL